MEILIKAFIAFGLAFLIIAFLHWLVNKNNEKDLYKHGNAVDGYDSPTGDFNVPEPVPEPPFGFFSRGPKDPRVDG